MIQAGWVKSGRGPGGGYQLTEAAFEVRLLEVVEATEGPTANERCVLARCARPGDVSCPIHTIWMKARGVLVERFESVLALEILGGKQR